MKLSEALIRRADAQKRIGQIQQRLLANAMVQEGEQPAENPADLLAELDRVIAEFTELVQQINHTNAVTQFDNGRTVTAALAERDSLMQLRSVLTHLAQAASVRQGRFTRSEVRYVSTVNVAAIQERADDLSQQYRELDTRIQELNWQTDLIE